GRRGSRKWSLFRKRLPFRRRLFQATEGRVREKDGIDPAGMTGTPEFPSPLWGGVRGGGANISAPSNATRPGTAVLLTYSAPSIALANFAKARARWERPRSPRPASHECFFEAGISPKVSS